MKRVIVHERFKSLSGLLSAMDERPINKAFKTFAEPSSQRTDNAEWRGSKNYKEATETIRTGYKEPLERMKKAIVKIGRKEDHKSPRLKTDMIGFVPNVPAHIMNLPETMFNKQPRQAKAKTIHLNYSFSASAITKKENLIQGGINFISLVNSLEKQGYRVKIDIIFCVLTDKTAGSFTVTVKEYGQNLNLLKLAFPLVHPSMLRRIGFKWLETTPDLKDELFQGGYGVPLSVRLDDLNKEREFLHKNEILNKNSFYCNVYQAFKAKSVKELANVIGIK